MKNILYGISATALIIGMLVFAYSQSWIIFNFPHLTYDTVHPEHVHTIAKKMATISYYDAPKIQTEEREIIWSTNHTKNLTTLTQNWLALLDEEELLEKRATLQIATIEANEQTGVLSFDRAPFNEADPAHIKHMYIEGLLCTVQDHLPLLKNIRFLVHHQPLNDYHLDFARPWPVTGFSYCNDHSTTKPTPPTSTSFTIMLDPAGDAQNTGRIIGDNFERGISLQFAQALKHYLERELDQVRVILSRFPGETLEPLQNAAFANRLATNLYVSLHFYPEAQSHTHWYTYTFAYDPITDFWNKNTPAYTFIPYYHAHEPYTQISWYYIKTMQEILMLYHTKGMFELMEPCALPFKPLIGVNLPAIGHEIGLARKDDWKLYIEPLAKSLIATVENILQT